MSDERLDRRVVFFLAAAALAAVLVPFANEFWWVAAVTAGAYVLLALGSFLDARSRGR